MFRVYNNVNEGSLAPAAVCARPPSKRFHMAWRFYKSSRRQAGAGSKLEGQRSCHRPALASAIGGESAEQDTPPYV